MGERVSRDRLQETIRGVVARRGNEHPTLDNDGDAWLVAVDWDETALDVEALTGALVDALDVLIGPN